MNPPTKTLAPPQVIITHAPIILAGRYLVCIMPGCNGKNHVWCSCD